MTTHKRSGLKASARSVSSRRVSARRVSAKEKEFEQLLRRAALYAKRHGAEAISIACRKRGKAA